MEDKLVYVGIFWAIPNEIDEGSVLEFKKGYYTNEADGRGFINYPYSHFKVWDDEVKSLGDDCCKYPRGRVLYDVNRDRHRIFADECVSQEAIDEIAELFDIENYELCRDEHYVCASCSSRKKVSRKTLAYNVLRGKDKIGENLIEIIYGETKILVELGKAIDGGEELSDTEKRVINSHYNAVIVSHYHADHAGLIGQKQDCPIYMGNGAYRIIKAMSEYLDKTVANNVKTYRNGRAFFVGGIKITPFLCDHSAFDSYMLLFEAGGKSILYTGDFRFHGRKNKEGLLSRLPRKVNTLICEGTNVGSGKPCFSESELEENLVEIIRQSEKPVFVLQSATNIDRLVSVYRAAKRSGRILYEDNFTALIATAAGGKIPRPDVFKDVYAFTPRRVVGKRRDMFFEFENKRGWKEIVYGKKFVMIVRATMLEHVERLYKRMDLSGATLVYSIWNGYKKDEPTAEFLNRVGEMGINIIDLHTSGHASAEDIELLKQTVCADEHVTVHSDGVLTGMT